MPERRSSEPAIHAPKIVVAILGVLVGVHLLREFGPIGLNEWMIEHFAFASVRLGFTDSTGAPGGGYDSALGFEWWRIFTFASYALLHGDWTHLIFNGAWFLAFGTPIAQRMDSGRFVGFFIVCAVSGALVYWVANYGDMALMVGASGAISGLMGATFRIMFVALDLGGLPVLQNHVEHVPRPSVRLALQDRRVLMSIFGWVLINLIFGILVPQVLTEGGIAWEAHLGGFFAGFLLFGLFDQGPSWEDIAREGAREEARESEDAGEGDSGSDR